MDNNSLKKWKEKGFLSLETYELLQNNEYLLKESQIDYGLKISVAISTHNRCVLLRRLLESILHQTYKNVQIVIADDASTDGTNVLVKDFCLNHADVEILYVKNTDNLGVGETKKKAYKQCIGDIVIFSDDDDYYVDMDYFRKIANIFKENDDCTMTVASTLMYYENEDRYNIQIINTPVKISCREYLNGFMKKYDKPNSMFTMALRSSSMKKIDFINLKYYNDTPLYLYGLLAEGYVYSIKEAVGVYYINGKNMTGNAGKDCIIGTLEAKVDVYNKACDKALLDNPKKWYYDNLMATVDYYLLDNVKVVKDDIDVWKWVEKHLSFFEYYRYVLYILIERVFHCKEINILYIPTKTIRKKTNN